MRWRRSSTACECPSYHEPYLFFPGWRQSIIISRHLNAGLIGCMAPHNGQAHLNISGD